MADILYIRVSTDAQSLARQEALCDTVQPDRVFREKASGKNTDRPALRAMLEYLREGDTLHVESISRLARSTMDLLFIVNQLSGKDVGFVSHKEAFDTSTPQGRFVLQIFASLSELERETTLQRTREGIDAARKAGTRFGRPRVSKPAKFDATVARWQAGEITATEAYRLLGLSKTTFYRLLRDDPTGGPAHSPASNPSRDPAYNPTS